MLRTMMALVVGLCVWGAAWAGAPRQFPVDSQVTTLKAFDGSTMTFGTSVLLLFERNQSFSVAPGLQIRDQNNLLVLPANLVGDMRLKVRVQFDSQGTVWRVWILSAEEIDQS